MRGTLPASATELGRFSDRLSFLYVEHAVVDRDAGAVTFWQEDGVASIPAAMLAALLAGSGCSVAWTGENGVRLYAGATTAATSSALLQRQAALVSGQRTRLAVARTMYAMRFPGEDLRKLTMQQLRGREGARVRACYADHARIFGVRWDGRRYDRGNWPWPGKARQGALQGERHTAPVRVRAARARLGSSWQCWARQWLAWARRGVSSPGKAGSFTAGWTAPGFEPLAVTQGSAQPGTARRGAARRGGSQLGTSRHGKARQGQPKGEQWTSGSRSPARTRC